MTPPVQVFDQEFLAATEGELYLGAKSWCLANTSSETEALKLFLDKFVAKITPEYMSQRDFLTCVANDAFLGQVRCLFGKFYFNTYLLLLLEVPSMNFN